MSAIAIDPEGTITAIYNDDDADLYEQGQASIARASHVEPILGGWHVELAEPFAGAMDAVELTARTFRLRAEALAAEVEYLTRKLFA
jgi:hypothetical protein